ncbi:hypothetical protein [Levilactobacillus parabrevis]|uniref:hypothetical protein n=1 Tax=Levilactobacillus parabrevis TaxID=357278 RepID=UPI003756BF29
MARIATIIKRNAVMRDQLNTVNQAYWSQLVKHLREQPKYAANETLLQRDLADLLTEILAAQKAGQSAEDYLSGGPATVAIAMGKLVEQRPWWQTWDALVPLLVFTLGTILPSVILPAVPLQLLLVAVQYGLFILAMGLGLWLTQRFTIRGRLIGWLVIIVGLLAAMGIAARTVPAHGLVYLTRVGGSITLLVFAVIITGLAWWQNRQHPNAWLPAVLGSLWITTLLALLARFPATSGLMVTSAGNLLIGLGTLLGDASVLIIGWRIWQARQHKAEDA